MSDDRDQYIDFDLPEYTVDNDTFITITASDTFDETRWGDLHIQDNHNIVIGDEVVMSGEEFKTCLKLLLKQLKESNPEEFI